MFEQIMPALGKEKDSNEVGETQISNSEVSGDITAFKFLPEIEFPIFRGNNARI